MTKSYRVLPKYCLLNPQEVLLHSLHHIKGKGKKQHHTTLLTYMYIHQYMAIETHFTHASKITQLFH